MSSAAAIMSRALPVCCPFQSSQESCVPRHLFYRKFVPFYQLSSRPLPPSPWQTPSRSLFLGVWLFSFPDGMFVCKSLQTVSFEIFSTALPSCAFIRVYNIKTSKIPSPPSSHAIFLFPLQQLSLPLVLHLNWGFRRLFADNGVFVHTGILNASSPALKIFSPSLLS